MSWNPSKKWNVHQRHGILGIVRLDVNCGHCDKLLAEDIKPSEVMSHGLHVDKPMDVFCDRFCMTLKKLELGKNGKPAVFFRHKVEVL